jgi:transposase InsO family protein
MFPFMHVPVQPSYSEARHKELTVHHGSLGHFGVDKTLASARASGLVGSNLEKDVKEFIRFCPICQKMSYVRPIIFSTPYVSSGTSPMKELHIDTVGPFPKDISGSLHIIVIIDNFTRYVTLHASANTSAEEAAKALFNHCCVYGVPSNIHTDNGSQYCNMLISSLTNFFNIKHGLSIAYSKQESGIVERVNKEVNRHLRALVARPDQSNKWASMLPLVQRIINASNHVATGFSPAQLLFGDSVDHRRGLFPTSITSADGPMPPTFTNTHEWLTHLLLQQQTLLKSARSSQETLNNRNLSERNEKREGEAVTSHPLGSYVLVKYPQSTYGRGPPTKLLPFWKGPMLVETVAGNKYSLRNIVTGKIVDYHLQLLKPFLFDERFVSPVEVAISEHDEYLVDAILDHKFLGGDKDKLVCLVSWLGYQEESWEPVSNLRLVEKFHDYAKAHKLVRFIPASFKTACVAREDAA